MFTDTGVSGAKNAGYYIGIGFRDGLASTRSSVMSTARSIAKEVKKLNGQQCKSTRVRDHSDGN